MPHSPFEPRIITNTMSSFVGTKIESLPTPAFVVDLDVAKNNCAVMLARAKEAGVDLRAQVKTHKTLEGAVMQTGGTKRLENG